MDSFQEYMKEYRNQLEKGRIQKAYKGLMEYIMDLRTYFCKQHPDYYVSGNIYFGYMDMTYFSVIPKFFKQLNLKIAIVFLHAPCRFEVWLAGSNKQVQKKYWTFIKESQWHNYRIVPTTQGVDSIMEHILVDDPDFSELAELTKQIEREALKFMMEVEKFLSSHQAVMGLSPSRE